MRQMHAGEPSETRGQMTRRLENGLERGQAITIVVDGLPVPAFEGESVAAALLAAGTRVLKTTARYGAPRGLYCGMGVCFECVMTVEGRPNVRACQTPVRAGMHIETQRGAGQPANRDHTTGRTGA